MQTHGSICSWRKLFSLLQVFILVISTIFIHKNAIFAKIMRRLRDFESFEASEAHAHHLLSQRRRRRRSSVSANIKRYCSAGWGSHSAAMAETPYVTAAASVGMTSEDIALFIKRLDKVLAEINKRNAKKGAAVEGRQKTPTPPVQAADLTASPSGRKTPVSVVQGNGCKVPPAGRRTPTQEVIGRKTPTPKIGQMAECQVKLHSRWKSSICVRRVVGVLNKIA